MLAALLCLSLAAMAQNPGLFQTTNPYYPKPNPFYFEGKVTWEYLKITTPSNFWEYLQRGIHKQDRDQGHAGERSAAQHAHTAALHVHHPLAAGIFAAPDRPGAGHLAVPGSPAN
jgi:hypothetical protein